MAQGLKVGTLLHNTYRIKRVLGQGGFGITYLAVDTSLDREVAVKEFFPKDYCDRQGDTSHVTLGTQNTSEFVNRLKAKFLKEAKNIAKFDNPGIIKIYAAFEENNTAYYVMDYIEGETLSSIVKSRGPLSERKALEYIEKVGKALEYVHSHRMNHLDVKPANIMVRKKDDEPILIDFGLSKQYDSEGHQTSTTPAGVSHGYAPMEQYNDGGVKEFSPQTDLYSLAATLYYILSGVVPPQATRLVDEELTFPSTIPSPLIAPIAKAMASGRKSRQETIGQFMAEIEGEPATEIAQSQTPPKPRNEPKTRKKATPNTQPKKPANPRIRKKKSLKYLIWGGCAIAVCLVIYLAIPRGQRISDIENDSDSAVVITVKEVNEVNGIYYVTSLGPCSYTGEVDDEGKPHGKGKAEWNSGVGKEYDGEWVHGAMDGESKYVSSKGYRFFGRFKANHYSEGKLVAPDGTYYEGTFDKNGDKWTGTEYDANGNATDTWKNGE